MENAGSSTSTIASYKMDLRVALDEHGAETPMAAITPEMVATYYASKRVTKLKSGQPKAKASIDKARRVLRLALVWAQETGLIDRAPLPETVDAKSLIAHAPQGPVRCRAGRRLPLSRSVNPWACVPKECHAIEHSGRGSTYARTFASGSQ